jgi:quinohemoprotein ethanol dehydrogenase
MAYSADEGELLFEVRTGQTGGMSPPMTYMLDGKQYVALAGGQGNLGFGGRGGRGRGNNEPTQPPAFSPPDSGNPTLMVFTLP